jgi:hypothetical protein
MKTLQELPFSIILSRRDETSSRLFATRIRSYGRHNDPLQESEHFRKQLIDDDAVLISAECKVSGECFGSVRIESNSIKRFYFEEEITTEDLKAGSPAICVSRLNVTNGQIGSLVRAAICKALYLYANAMQCQFIYAFVDKPRSRLYSRLAFQPAIDGNPDLHLRSHNGLPFRLYFSDVSIAMAYLPTVDPKMFDFFFNTFHPDIKIFSSVGSRSQASRRNDPAKAHQRVDSALLPTPTV